MERPLVPPEPPPSDGMIVLRPWRRGDAPVLASVFGSADAGDGRRFDEAIDSLLRHELPPKQALREEG